MIRHATQPCAISTMEIVASAQVKKEIHVLEINLRMVLVTMIAILSIVILIKMHVAVHIVMKLKLVILL